MRLFYNHAKWNEYYTIQDVQQYSSLPFLHKIGFRLQFLAKAVNSFFKAIFDKKSTETNKRRSKKIAGYLFLAISRDQVERKVSLQYIEDSKKKIRPVSEIFQNTVNTATQAITEGAPTLCRRLKTIIYK